MASLINRIQRAVLGSTGPEQVRALLAELAIPIGGSGERALSRVRRGILRPISDEAVLRDALGDLGLTGGDGGGGHQALWDVRNAILLNLRDSEGTLRHGLDSLLTPGDLAGVAPTDIAWAGTHTVAEGAALGTQVGGALSVTDPDAGDTVDYSLVNDAGGLFGISGTSVIVTGVTDYETATSHDITIRATDRGDRTYDEVFAITVTDVAEAPPDIDPGDGDIIVDDPAGFDVPPTVTSVDGAISFHGKKKTGSSGKFIFDIGAAVAGNIYTMSYDPDWSLLGNGGATAMVAFGLRHGNDFRLSGLKGDGSSGLKAYEIFGANKWNQVTGFTASDGGAAAHGTQGGPNWLRFEVSADGSTYTLRTSSDGTTWADEFTAVAPAPFADVDGVASFGIAVFLDSNDAGPFRVDITFWEAQPSLVATTWNPADKSANVTLSNGNLTAAAGTPGGSYSSARAIAGKTTGKHYFEAVLTGSLTANSLVGIGNASAGLTTYIGATNNSIGLNGDGNVIRNNGQVGTVGVNPVSNDRFSVAVDRTNNMIWFRVNGGNWNNNAANDPATNTGGIAISAVTGTIYPMLTGYVTGDVFVANFGGSALVHPVPAGFAPGWAA